MKNIIPILLFFVCQNLISKWYVSDELYNYKLDNVHIILNYEDIYFVSNIYNLVILKPQERIEITFDEMADREFGSTFTLHDIEYHDGFLFFASQMGLFRYSIEDNSWKFYDKENSDLPDHEISNLTSTGDELIINTRHASIVRYKSGKFFTDFIGDFPDIVPNIALFNYKYFKEAFYYFSLRSSFCKYQDDSITVIKKYSPEFIDYPSEKISFCFEENAGKLYFATTRNRFFSFDGYELEELFNLNEAFKGYDSLQIASFYFDKNNNLVAHMKKYGLNGFISYNYLLIVNNNYESVLYDFIEDLNLNNFYYPMQKHGNGNLFLNSKKNFVSNGDPALSIETGRDLWLWNLYPNPVHDILNIEVYTTAAGSDNLEVNIYDIAGRHILSKHQEADFNPMTGKSTSSIELNELKRGFYIFTITNGDWTKASTLMKR